MGKPSKPNSFLLVRIFFTYLLLSFYYFLTMVFLLCFYYVFIIIFVEGWPYCEGCGRQAFVTSRLQRRSQAVGGPAGK